MAFTEHQTIGLVLRRFDYGETSQIGHLLTPDAGRISVLAKGIKKPNSYLKGPFDLFQLAKITYRSSQGSALGLLQRYEPMTGFPKMRKKLGSLLSAFYLADILYQSVREEDPNHPAFEVLMRAFGALDASKETAARPIVLASEFALLQAIGFAVEVEKCVRCQSAPTKETMAIYPQEGGYVCSRCPSPGSEPVVVDPDHIRLLILLGSHGPVEAAEIPLSRRQHRSLRGLMARIFLGIFEKPILSEPFALDPQWGFLEKDVKKIAPSVSSDASR